jgi:C-terminal processing protease CtpA/Prc
MRFRNQISAVVSVSLIVAATACEPVPRRPLTAEEKTADLYWVYSQFNENYAPLEYKQSRFGFDYAALKARYLQDAVATRTNEEFFDLLYKFVSEFKDAHTSASLTNSDLPNRAKVAYLGFSGKRRGNALLVTELLPTIDTGSTRFPVKVGDKITKLDGVALADVVDREMARYRDLGHREANLTYHFNKIFNRVSTSNGLPSKDAAVLTIGEGDAAREVTVPWIVKDLVEFRRQQAAARGTTARPRMDTDALQFDNGAGGMTRLGFVGFNGELVAPGAMMSRFRRGETFKVWDTFQFLDGVASWTALPSLAPDTAPAAVAQGSIGETLAAGPADAVKKVRNVPERAVFLPQARVFPTYVTREKVKNAEGKVTGSKLVAYMLLDTFSPSAPRTAVMAEVKATLAAMQELGVRDLVIDMLNNGGGSLILGLELAQALSSRRVEMPGMQFQLSQTWLDDFEKSSREAASDAEAELARRVYEEMRAEQQSGKRLSRPFPVDSLVPYLFEPNTALEGKLNVVLLINEMCASMCDIFSGVLQDNGMAKIVGSQSMGAGGNVVDHQMAPNSHLTVRQTESLILRKNGTYIENNGILPDVPMNVTESVQEKYDPVRAKAIELLTTEPAPAPAPAPVPAVPAPPAV